MGKYLNLTTEQIFQWVCPGPSDDFPEPKLLIATIQKVIDQPTTVPDKPPVRFAIDKASVQANTELLRQESFDFQRLYDRCSGTTMQPGSEFRHHETLQLLFGRHPHWPFFKSTLIQGMSYEFTEPLTESARKTEVAAMIDRGNHKSAVDHADKVRRLLAKDVHHGFSMVFDPSIIPSIPNALVQPLGVVEQFTITATGDRTLKHRLTQDLSFSLAVNNASVNDRIDMSKYPDMFYGFCLQRVAHLTVALRAREPNRRILIAKYDYSDAYRRIAHSPQATAQSIVVFEGVAFAALRLNPPGFCAFSEMVTDLANEIRMCKSSWDHTSLFSPSQPEPPRPRYLDSDLPFSQASRLAVDVPVTHNGRVDCFIDDLINVFVDDEDSWAREAQIVPLAIHAASRPHAGIREPVPRRPTLSPDKLAAEGTPAEIQVVLGWQFDTRRLLISLPNDKFAAWHKDVADLISSKVCSMSSLDSLIGKLNHAGYVIPLARHFLSRLRARLDRGKGKRHRLQIHKSEVDDLVLWQTFLRSANHGISLNNLVLRTPSRLCWSDSCPLGLGGFVLESGRAWRLRIPQQSILQTHKGTNNLLEFLALVVSTLLVLQECGPVITDPPECIMSLADNTSAISWVFRSQFNSLSDPLFEAKTLVARHLAHAVTTSRHCLASQHIKGEHNVVADYLSFAGTHRTVKHHPLAYDDPDDTTLTRRFHFAFPQLIPATFKISPLPADVFSFALQTLQIAESSLIRAQRAPTSDKTESGVAGPTTVRFSTTVTPSSITYPSLNANSSCDVSWNYTGKPGGTLRDELLVSVRNRWYDRLSKVPQGLWARRFGQISNQAPCTSPTATSFPPSEPS